MTKDNRTLGEFDLEGIPPMKAGDAQIEVIFDLDENGVLNVHANEKTGKKSNKITI
jgi:molecular chaperone DnaK (HSP70)